MKTDNRQNHHGGIMVLLCFAMAFCQLSCKKKADDVSVAPQTNQTAESNAVAVSSQPAGDTSALAAAARSLAVSGNSDETVRSVEKLREHLRSIGTNAASAEIQQWLNSGNDAPTRLEFKLSRDGSLKGAPTLRTFLLDQLAQLDPKAAAAYAENIFRSSNSPDEWAVALRAYALGNPTDDGKAYLQQRVRELLRNEEWGKNPSAGFLEAFDVIVHTHDTALASELGSLVRQQDNRALSHAAYLTMDRLVQSDTAEMLGEMQTHPDLLEGRENTRADFFARADVRDAQQKTILENYLLDAKRSPKELEQFVGIYPNANYMVSYNLLTPTVTPTGDELASRDREALKVVNEWLADPKFARIQPQLKSMKSRLEQFVKPNQP